MRAKRSAAAPPSSAAPPRRAPPRRARRRRARSSSRAQRERDLAQARVARRAREVVDRLAHLDRVAGRAAQHAVHVGQQRRRWAGRCPSATSTIAARELVAPARASGRKAPEPTLTSITSASSPAASFLDRIEATISGIDSTVPVASRIAYSRRSAGARSRGLADDRAARARARPRRKRVAVGRRVVARDRVELVERAAGVAEAAAGDHRHRAAAGRDDRREQQADLVADAAGRVLVEHRAGRGPASDQSSTSPESRHRAGQRDALVRRHAR